MTEALNHDVAEKLEELHIPLPQPIEIDRSNLADDGVSIPAPVAFPSAFEVQGANVFMDGTLVGDLKPKGINPKDLIGATKVDLSLVPPAATLHTATAMMDGAAKYGPYNWRENPVKAMVYIAAAQRHLSQFLDGENFDPISGVHHLGHASACLAIMLDAIETGNLADNRPIAGKSGEIIRRFNADTKLA